MQKFREEAVILLTNGEIIKMIDIYLETPSCIDNKWVQALTIIRKLLVKEIDKQTEEAARLKQLPKAT